MKPSTIRGPAHQTNGYCYTAHRQVECILLCSSGQVRSHLIGCGINIKPSTLVWCSGMKRTISPLSKMHNSRRFDVYLIALIIYLGFATVAHAQDKPLYKQCKNIFEIVFSPTLSKTSFPNFTDYATAPFERAYENKKPTKPIIAYYYGINYKRVIGSNYFLSIGLYYSRNGQRSPVTFSVRGIPDAELIAREGYGGTFYRLTYDSYDALLLFGYKWKTSKRFQYYFTGGIAGNVYDGVKAEKFSVNRLTGQIRGSLQDTFLQTTGGSIKELRQRIDDGLWRPGIIVGGGVQYWWTPHFFIACQPEFRYYSPPRKAKWAQTVVSGSIINFGIDIGVGAAF